MVGHLADVITYAKFQYDTFRGYDFTGGRISHFPIDFRMGLTTMQCDNTDTEYQTDVKSTDNNTEYRYRRQIRHRRTTRTYIQCINIFLPPRDYVMFG